MKLKDQIKKYFPNAEGIEIRRDDSFMKKLVAEWMITEGDQSFCFTMNVDLNEANKPTDSNISVQRVQTSWWKTSPGVDYIYPNDDEKPVSSCLSEARTLVQEAFDLELKPIAE